MISIASRAFDLNGSFLITNREARIRLGTVARRATKTATLDGGTSVYDTGVSPGDREFEIQINNPTKALISQIKYLIENHSEFTISTIDGLFIGYIGSINGAYSKTSVILSITDKVA